MISRYLKFVISRALGTGVDTLVLWCLAHFVFDGGYWATYVLSPIISFECAVMSNFLCSYYWIWSSRITTHNSRSFWRHFVTFNLSSLAGFGVKMLFLLLLEKIFGWGVVVCNLAALCLSGMLNYALSEWLVFRNKQPQPTHKLLSEEELATLTPLFRGRLGRIFAHFAMWVCGVGRINRIYDTIYPNRGIMGARAALEELGCNYLVGNAERLEQLPKGAFITISNHPYGTIDGIVLLDMVGRHRPDLRIMVNKILGRVESMSDNFITVTPTEQEKHQADATTIAGIKTSLRHLREGHPLGLFPAGAVSDLHLPSGKIYDREWQEGIVRLIEKAQVPVVPIHFEGRNSLLYYSLGLIDWRVRLLRLPREVLNKGRGKHCVTIGRTISPEELRQAGSTEALRQLLRKAVYQTPSPSNYTPANRLPEGSKQ